MIFLQELKENQDLYLAIVRAKDSEFIMRGVAAQLRRNLQTSLAEIFSDEPNIPLEVLVRYSVSAQLSLIEWWMTNRNNYSAYQICQMLHRLQRSAICEAYRVKQHDT